MALLNRIRAVVQWSHSSEGSNGRIVCVLGHWPASLATDQEFNVPLPPILLCTMVRSKDNVLVTSENCRQSHITPSSLCLSLSTARGLRTISGLWPSLLLGWKCKTGMWYVCVRFGHWMNYMQSHLPIWTLPWQPLCSVHGPTLHITAMFTRFATWKPGKSVASLIPRPDPLFLGSLDLLLTS